ncbi:hypothetical protein FIBSPDRAFT_1046708 [Athelia psychrophila]|uniref:Lytic polysaccharide monooxygenase n=1 Tax=Athelia psychrophila TaxID=1759441 RepID=A0A166GCZ3_9AGAM|nr:hypothetical protein FIBSPDRAFT_1046708 [Fibularhizoctonia sp. CBS 109695]
MQFKVSSILLALAAIASAAPARRKTCVEANRYGSFAVVPSTVAVGGSVNITTDFTCALTYLEIVPKYIDYYIEVLKDDTTNANHEAVVMLERRLFTTTIDSFITTIPDAYYFTTATYEIRLYITYSMNGTAGIPYWQVAVIDGPLNITGISSS